MFHIVDRMPPQAAAGQVYLVVDNWDDWFKYRTMFTMIVDAPDGTRHFPGSVKIGELGLLPSGDGRPLGPGVRSPALPVQFDELAEGRYFSLGQDENYYETLNNFEPDFKRAILVGLRDCAYDLAIFERFRI